MQQRRMKRLAGPALYVNVKYNQKLANENKKAGPTRHERYRNFHEWELFDIKEGEILVCPSDKQRTRDHFARVISSLNGGLREDEDEEKLLEKHTFFGIAQTEHKAEKNPQINQGLVSTVGGLATIINDHDSFISPGDLLFLSEPKGTVPHRGIPKDKKRFCLEPGRQTSLVEDIYESDHRFYERLCSTSFKGENYEYLIEKLANIIDKRRLPVAKALSQSKKGERLDILLHPRLPTVRGLPIIKEKEGRRREKGGERRRYGEEEE